MSEPVRDIERRAHMMTFAAEPPQTADPERRTVDVVFYTGAAVQRYSAERGEYYDLVFELTPEAADFSLLNTGAPVLDCHAQWRNADRIGVVERAWLEDGTARATLRFSDRPDVEPIWRDIAGGIARKFSMGVEILSMELREDGTARPRPLYAATRWQPYEISPVPVAADMGTTCLSAERSGERLAVPAAMSGTQMEVIMPEQHAPVAAPETPREQLAPNEEERSVVAIDRFRTAQILDAAVRLGVDVGTAQRLVASDLSLPQCRAEIQRVAAEQAPQITAMHGVPTASLVADGADKFASAAEAALMHRLDKQYPLPDAARELRGLGMRELAREYARYHRLDCGDGIGDLATVVMRHRLSREGAGRRVELLQGMHTTSDFANLLANVAHKRLLMAFETTPMTFLPWTLERDLPDFKTAKVVRRTALPSLDAVPEGQPYKYITFGDTGENYALGSYGNLIAISRQVIIGDDLRALDDILGAMGAAAADTRGDVVYALLTNNGAMSDGVALFHATHNNLLGSGAAPSIAQLGAMLMKLRKQTENSKKLNLTMAHLVLPAELEFVARQIFAAFVATQPSNAKPDGLLALVNNIHSDARLDDTSIAVYYGFADPARAPVIVRGTLDGQGPGPAIERNEVFESGAIVLKVTDDFGAAVVGYHGGVCNPGA